MCGIFGLVAGSGLKLSQSRLIKTINDLFILSESRGREASGFAGICNDEIIVYKTPLTASKMIKSDLYKENINEITKGQSGYLVCIGHSRLVTSGYEQHNHNNQPVIKKDIVGIHNGIVVNVENLWSEYPDEKKETDLDTEIIPVIINANMKQHSNLHEALCELYNKIYGMSNIALLFSNFNNLILATNNGSIYYFIYPEHKIFIFASEHYILRQLLIRNPFIKFIKTDIIQQLNPRSTVCVNYNELSIDVKDLNSNKSDFINLHTRNHFLKIKEILPDNSKINNYRNTSLEHIYSVPTSEFIDEYHKRRCRIESLHRCTKCILPETFPYIEFDNNGECNYCRNYQKIDYKGTDDLIREIKPSRKNNNRPDVLIPFSGGRDSSFTMHYLVKELGLKPLAFSYDWGMLTDLARRNQARMCDKLGVEHILISADIREKRENIRKNVSAWLRRPNLGTVPLFMAGDKQYFYFANRLMKQNHLNVSVLGENLLETTKFKSGFCGVKPRFNKENTYFLPKTDKIRMLAFYWKEYLINPAYLNSSLLDTLGAFNSYYLIKHKNINLFNYIKWDENIITDVLLKEYDWEIDPGTRTTWRIGDGTAAFYNYIYYMVAGFTENDTFRSNQIREGDITRDESLKLSFNENQPRWDSIQWYCRTIGIDFENTIRVINNTPPLYGNI